MGVTLPGPPVVIRPGDWPRQAFLPSLGLIPAGSLDVAEVEALKNAEGLPVHLVFPVGRAQEAANLRSLLKILWPLKGRLLDRVWIAFGGRRPDGLSRLSDEFPGLSLFSVRKHLPPDQMQAPLGKGAAMRAMLYHLVAAEGLSHPRAVVEFLDADIRPSFFGHQWLVDPMGALIRFPRLEAAKVVYHRPRGGRLNAMMRSLIALCPHPGVQHLQKLAYLLSGEMAATLRFWLSLPFSSGYGVEILTLMSLALNQLNLCPGRPDLDVLVQVHVGHMDHRHAPLTSTARRRGLDQMAGAVFHTFFEILRQENILQWQPPPTEPPELHIPLPLSPGERQPAWLRTTLGDLTLPPLKTLKEIGRRLAEGT